MQHRGLSVPGQSRIVTRWGVVEVGRARSRATMPLGSLLALLALAHALDLRIWVKLIQPPSDILEQLLALTHFQLFWGNEAAARTEGAMVRRGAGQRSELPLLTV